MLSSAFGIIQGVFSRPFIVGLFFPALMFLVLNGLAIALCADAVAPKELPDPKDALEWLGAGVFLLIFAATMLGFCLAPLVAGMEHLLSGAILPRGVRRNMITTNRQRASDLSRQMDFVRVYLQRLEGLCERAHARLREARATGNALQDATPGRLVVHAVEAIDGLRHTIVKAGERTGQKWSFAGWDRVLTRMTLAVDRLAKALESNTVDFRDPESVESKAHGVALDLAVASLTLFTLMNDAKAAGAGLMSRLREERAKVVALDSKPTQFGNLRAEMEAYTDRVYDVSFLYLWSRLEVLISDPAKFTVLNNARTQLDFVLMIILLATISIVGWLTRFLWDGRTLHFAALALTAPFVLRFFYSAALESQRAWTQAVKAIMDGHRLELLKTLAAPDPRTDEEERAIWTALQRRAAGVRAHDDKPFAFRPLVDRSDHA